MKIVAIVQARMGSTRRPGKVLADIHGKPLLGRLLDRLNATKLLNEIVVATTINNEDDILVEWLLSNNIKFFRGSEEDVLDRYYQCAHQFNADIIVRITADDPLKDPGVINHAIEMYLKNDSADYVSNTIIPTYPEGIDVEVFSFNTLHKAHGLATKKSDREHVTPYIWRNREQFNLLNFSAKIDMSSFRLTVDYEEDLTVVIAIFGHFLEQPLIGYQDIVEFLNNSPNVAAINSGILRNEGYMKSLVNENKNEDENGR